MSTKQKTKVSAKGLLTNLTAGRKEAKHEDQDQAEEQKAPEPISATEAEVVQADAGKEAQRDGETQVEAPHQEQGVPEPEPAEQQLAYQDVLKDQMEAAHLKPADPQQSIEQQPDNGKGSLPQEPEELPDEDEEGDQEEEPVFTDEDKADLPVQEGKFKHHGDEQARAIIEIRQRKLWMIHCNDDGSRKYKTFDHYMDEHWGYTRQWVTQLTKWLKVKDLFAKLGLSVCLSANAANGLWQLDAAGGYQGSTQEEQEENGLIAVIEEAQDQGASFSRDNLRGICERRVSYFRARKGSHPPAAPTYAAYKQDCEVAKSLRSGGSIGVVGEARKLPGNFADNLINICTEQRKLPRAEELLEVVTGTALEEIMPRLVTLAQDVTNTEAKKNLLKTRKAEIRAMLKEGGLAKLREETQALQTELEEKGVIKKRGSGSNKNGQGSGGSTTKKEDAGADDAGSKDADEEEPEEEQLNDVQGNLDTALECLEAALEAEWPEPDDADMIQAILNSAQACDQKLTEIINKAKELLADESVKVIALPDPYFLED